MDIQNISNRTHRESCLVKEIDLLYKLADAKLLEHLNGSAPNRFKEGKRVWYFDKTDEVLAVIDAYFENKPKRHDKRELPFALPPKKRTVFYDEIFHDIG